MSPAIECNRAAAPGWQALRANSSQVAGDLLSGRARLAGSVIPAGVENGQPRSGAGRSFRPGKYRRGRGSSATRAAAPIRPCCPGGAAASPLNM